MTKTYTLIIFLAFINAFAQEPNKAKLLTKKESENRFSFAFGVNLSSVNLSRNYRENPYKLGFNTRAYYEFNPSFRLMAEYIYTPKFDLEPTWYNVNSQVFGFAINSMAYIKDQEVMIYTISGLCLQRWKGFYSGQQDFSSARFFYDPNTEVLNRNIGLDLGLGFERPLPGCMFFGDFRYRFNRVDKSFGISDAAYSLGLKFLIYKEDLQKKGKPKSKSKRPRKSDKYHWF